MMRISLPLLPPLRWQPGCNAGPPRGTAHRWANWPFVCFCACRLAFLYWKGRTGRVMCSMSVLSGKQKRGSCGPAFT
eukprot:689233-Pelagomonas_calceolata.AAC.1